MEIWDKKVRKNLHGSAYLNTWENLPHSLKYIIVESMYEVIKENEFEKYTKLAEHLQRMATTGKTGTPPEWNQFLGELNKVLRQYCVSGELCRCERDNPMIGKDGGCGRCGLPII